MDWFSGIETVIVFWLVVIICAAVAGTVLLLWMFGAF